MPEEAVGPAKKWRYNFGLKDDRMNWIMNMTARLAIVFFILLTTVQALMAASPGAVYLNSVEGTVEYIPAATQKVIKAKPNMPIMEGDTVAVPGPGNAEVFVRDGSVLRITEGSRLKVLAIERTAVQFFLETGRVYVRFSGLNGYPLFLSTPSAQLDTYERSTFRADITPSGDTEVSAYRGQLYVAQPRGKMTIVAGMRLIMKMDAGTPVYTTNRPADAFDAWNRKKDGPDPGAGVTNPRADAPGNPGPGSAPPVVVYPAEPAVIDREYIYAAPVPYWGYSYYYYPWGYRPYPWRGYGPYYRGWGPRPYGYHNYGYRGRPYGPGPGNRRH